MTRRPPRPCRVNCRCAACGRVKLHVGGERPPNPNAPTPEQQAIADALRAMVAPPRR